MLSIAAVLVALVSVKAQFMLVWKTDGPTTPPALGPGGVNLNCKDKVPNCEAYGDAACKAPYDTWAKENCANTCHFCNGPTKAPPSCKDTIDDCDTYGQDVCTDPQYKSWVGDMCRYYCRMCSRGQLEFVDAHTTTLSPAACKDKVDCRLYGKNSCTGTYVVWAKENCAAYCGMCTGLPTPPAACVDKIPNCASYQKDMCTQPEYTLWADDNCRKYCGRCDAGNGQSPTYAVPPKPGKRDGI